MEIVGIVLRGILKTAAFMLIAVFIVISMLSKSVKRALSRRTTCPRCIVGVLRRNEYSDKKAAYECDNCEYFESTRSPFI